MDLPLTAFRHSAYRLPLTVRQRRASELPLELELESESMSSESRVSLELRELLELPERDELESPCDDEPDADIPLSPREEPPRELEPELPWPLDDEPERFWSLEEPDDALRLDPPLWPSPCDELLRSRPELLDEPLIPPLRLLCPPWPLCPPCALWLP